MSTVLGDIEARLVSAFCNIIYNIYGKICGIQKNFRLALLNSSLDSQNFV